MLERAQIMLRFLDADILVVNAKEVGGCTMVLSFGSESREGTKAATA